jgi:rRNA maturation RNase YbeY
MSQGVISFFVEDVHDPIVDQEEQYIHWLHNVAGFEGTVIGKINYIFCSDDYLLDINIKYLGHDYYTDIITFPYQQGQYIESDIYISLDRIRENAIDYHVSFENELRRVMVHGLLHLIGYGDKDESQAKTMRSKEEYYLEKFEG